MENCSTMFSVFSLHWMKELLLKEIKVFTLHYSFYNTEFTQMIQSNQLFKNTVTTTKGNNSLIQIRKQDWLTWSQVRFHMFNSPCWFGHLIKKRSQNCGFLSITELIQNNILYGCKPSRGIYYTYCTRHPRSKHSGGSWEQDDTVWVLQKWSKIRLTIYFSFRSTIRNTR